METLSTQPLENAHLEGIAWLEGCWAGRINGDCVEEIWARATAGAIMGMFRWVAKGELRFYEFITIAQNGKNIEMRIKHFDPDLNGWEEKKESTMFFLSELKDRQAVFFQESENKPLWLIYESADESVLRIYFKPQDNSPVGDRVFSFQRVDLHPLS